MLAPLLQWPPAPTRDPDAVALLSLGRGQTLGVTGGEWPPAFKAFRSAAAAGATPFEVIGPGTSPRDAADAVARSDKPLLLIALGGEASREDGEALSGALETLARRGGGAIVGADAFAPETRAQFSRVLEFPLQPAPRAEVPALRDDSGIDVAYLRTGDWAELYFPLARYRWPADAVRLEVEGLETGVLWTGELHAIEPWRRFIRYPSACSACLALPWPPGRYRARLAASRELPPFSAPVEFDIRAAEGAPPPAPVVQWRFHGLSRVTPAVASRSLRLPVRTELSLSEEDEAHLPSGWHSAEPAGRKRFRRWTSGEAIAILGGAGATLRIALHDHRPRKTNGARTVLALDVDGERRAEFDWTQGGPHEFRVPWIGDGLNHELRLRVDPIWVPARLGGEDHRELGVLIDHLGVENG